MKTETIKNLTNNELKQLAQTIEKEKGDAYDQLLGTTNVPPRAEG